MRQQGFTLVELLVVITVMALLATGVVMTLPASGAGTRDAAGRFAARVAAARDTAVLTGRPTGLWVSPSGYGFEQLRGTEWQPVDAPPLAQADWGRDVEAAVQRQARLRFDSIGLPDRALEVRLVSGTRLATVRIGSNGDVEVQ
ncbi:GspH/FimT family pseudopilin [Sphingomonas arenae]|uniref:GspH/FimT family pseudopilin n=1 Tax=Sphingomonas arenae TaxID=2812555 RepID=UPI001967227E|nr:GspH/FimT family pseudopilin [Sphingomonas arenae]